MISAKRQVQTALRIALGAAIAGVTLLPGGCASTRSGGEAGGTSRQYAFWPLAPDEPRVQFVKSFVISMDVQPRQQSGLERLVFGEENEGITVIDKPSGVAMTDGRIYVCDIRKEAVVVFDLRKEQMRIMGASGINRLGNPVDICVADDGKLYVSDNGRNAVVEFDTRERYSRTLGRPGMRPNGIAVYGDRLYVSDAASQSILIIDRRSGEIAGQFGTVGDDDGQFRLPLGIATDSQGRVYVMDFMRSRLQRFTAEGEFIDAFGELGDYAGSFAKPKHIAVDNEGILYVVDAAFQNVQMFNDEFKILMHFGSAGDHPGAMNLPMGVCTSDEGIDVFQDLIHPGFRARRLVVVTNQFGPQKVSVYALGDLRPGYTVADLSAAAAQVSAGVGTNPETERLQGTVEGAPAEDPSGEEPAQAETKPDTTSPGSPERE